MTVSYEVFSPRYTEQVFDLILSIQAQEFAIRITRADQPDLARIADFYQRDAGNFWIALAGDAVVGTIALLDIGERQVALRKMFVHADHRGRDKGVAQALLGQALSWAKDRGVRDIYLGTTAQFLAAHRFYEKNSFCEISKTDLPAAFPIMAVDTKFYHQRIG